MQLFLKRLKGDPVLLAAWGLALVSAFLVRRTGNGWAMWTSTPWDCSSA